MRGLIYISLLAALAVSCEKKKYPESVVKGTANFFFRGEVNGEPMVIEAGRNGYFMYSSFDAGDSIAMFKGLLQKQDCGTCDQALEIVFSNSHSHHPGEPVFTANSILPGEKEFYSMNGINVQFEATFNRDAVSYEWDFGDGQIGTGKNVAHRFAEPGKYDVCVTARSSNGCESSVCNRQDISFSGSRISVHSMSIGGDSLYFFADTAEIKSASYHWNFGDGTQATGSALTHYYEVPGSYPVILTAIDQSGNMIISRYNAVTGTDKSSCAANYKTLGLTGLGGELFSKVQVFWRDKGRLYSSSLATPQSDDRFEVLSVEDYKSNERNEAVKKVRVRMTATLSDGTSTIRLRDAEAVVAISYPK